MGPALSSSDHHDLAAGITGSSLLHSEQFALACAVPMSACRGHDGESVLTDLYHLWGRAISRVGGRYRGSVRYRRGAAISRDLHIAGGRCVIAEIVLSRWGPTLLQKVAISQRDPRYRGGGAISRQGPAISQPGRDIAAGSAISQCRDIAAATAISQGGCDIADGPRYRSAVISQPGV